MLSLTQHQARLLQLAAQGLLLRPRGRPAKADVVAVINRMRLLQIDSINVVARSPYMVLYSRLGAYPLAWLEELLADGALVETWAHEACFVTSDDYPMHAGFRSERSHHWAYRHAARMHAEHREGMDALLEKIRVDGPMRAADFERTGEGKSGGWWGWKPEKRWLEAWFALGDLMVLRRENFQRVYDLAGRVRKELPTGDVPTGDLSVEALRERFMALSVAALGVAPARQIADYFRLKPRVTDAGLASLLSTGELIRVTVTGWEWPAYIHRDHAGLAGRAAAGKLRATHTTLLSPFDPLIWDRDRASAVFDFDYTLECYTPAPRRRYGYYVLPILHRGRLVGRLDAKAHRADGLFEVKGLWLEPGVEADEVLVAALAGAIAECARWHGTPRVDIVRSEPKSLAAALRRAL
jgi:uncharacterized protein